MKEPNRREPIAKSIPGENKNLRSINTRVGFRCLSLLQGDISEAEVREALERLDRLWNELFPAEQARIYHLGHVVMRRY
jgi:hypothetical protein